MTRFNSPEEVIAWADKAAADDYKRHLPVHQDPDGTTWQVDKNPYSTGGARNDWQRGFDNAPPYSWESQTRDYDIYFQRGRAMARLLEKQKSLVPVCRVCGTTEGLRNYPQGHNCDGPDCVAF